MDQVNAKKGAWFTVYSTFRKKEDLPANQMQASNRSQRQQSAPTATTVGNSPYPTVTNGVASGRYPIQPKAYHVETASDEEDEEWDQARTY